MAFETPNTVQYSMRIKKTILADLKEIAYNNHGNVSTTLQWFVEEAIKQYKAKKAS